MLVIVGCLMVHVVPTALHSDRQVWQYGQSVKCVENYRNSTRRFYNLAYFGLLTKKLLTVEI